MRARQIAGAAGWRDTGYEKFGGWSFGKSEARAPPPALPTIANRWGCAIWLIAPASQRMPRAISNPATSAGKLPSSRKQHPATTEHGRGVQGDASRPGAA